MGHESRIEVARAGGTVFVRIAGRCTMHESRALAAHLCTLSPTAPAVAVDLTMCDYLDSTSLGWLVNEHKRLTEADREFRVVVRPDQYDGLFGPTKLQQVLPVDDAPLPEVAGWKPMEVGQCSTIEITEHALDCHRPLADMPGPSQQAFQRIVRRLADEMEGD